jgi:hypothetical protein
MITSTRGTVPTRPPRLPPELVPRPEPAPPAPPRRWLLLAAGLLLAGFLLFCHGCHGDEDNELFAVTVLPGPSYR